jgi:hypothetical protein
MTKNDRHNDAEIFAEILRKTKLPNEITIGKFILKGTKGVKDKIPPATARILSRGHKVKNTKPHITTKNPNFIPEIWIFFGHNLK